MFSWRCFPFVESAPRAYRLKASNAAPLSSTSAGTFPEVAALARWRMYGGEEAHERPGWKDRVRHGRRIGYRTGDRHRAVTGRGEALAWRYRGGAAGKGEIGFEPHERGG